MASAALASLTATTAPVSTDLLYLVRSPFGAGDDRKITFANLEAGLTIANQVGYSLIGLKASPLSQFASTTSAQLAGVISDGTGSGSLVFATSPTLVTPTLGVATATSLAIGGATIGSNGLAVTGHLLLEGVTSTGATGTGLLVFGTSPTLTTAVLGSSTATTQTPGDSSTKVATTAFVANAVLGQNFKEAAKYATAAALPTYVYANGSSGVGATLTGFAFGALSIDGNTPSIGDRILVNKETAGNAPYNGIYTVTTVGGGAAFFVMTRATDANQSFEWETGDSIFVSAGSTLATTTWAYTGIDSPVIGTNNITFAQTAGQGSFTAGNGISITGVSIAIDTAVTVDKTTAQTLTNKTLTSPTLTTPVLGTPSSGTLTSCTGLPIAGLVASTSTAIGVGSIELGNASDTTITRSGAGAIQVEGVQVILSGAALGTPSSGTLTNCTALPVAGITSSTSTALGVGSLEIGHASDTTLARVSAGLASIEGVTIQLITTAQTVTNKRNQPRVYTAANNASLTPEKDTYDIFHLTAMSAATTINNPSTTTAADGETMEIRFLDNGTARALTWGNAYVAKAGVALPTTTTLSKNLSCLFEWNANLSKWNLMATGLEA